MFHLRSLTDQIVTITAEHALLILLNRLDFDLLAEVLELVLLDLTDLSTKLGLRFTKLRDFACDSVRLRFGFGQLLAESLVSGFLVGDLVFKDRLLGLELVQFQLATLKVPQHLCFLGVEVATQLLFEPVVVLLEPLHLFNKLEDLFVDLTGAQLYLKDVLLVSSRDHTPIE